MVRFEFLKFFAHCLGVGQGNKRKAQCLCQLCRMRAFVGLAAGSPKPLSTIDFFFYK